MGISKWQAVTVLRPTLPNRMSSCNNRLVVDLGADLKEMEAIILPMLQQRGNADPQSSHAKA